MTNRECRYEPTNLNFETGLSETQKQAVYYITSQGWISAGRNLFLPHSRQKVTETTSFLPAEMIILKIGAIEHGAATGSAMEVLNF